LTVKVIEAALAHADENEIDQHTTLDLLAAEGKAHAKWADLIDQLKQEANKTYARA
jgi:hypothetical protein